MNLGIWGYTLWLGGFALNVLLLVVLLRKKRHHQLPWFTLLIAGDVLQTLVLFCVQSYTSLNFYTYWSFETIDAALRMLVVYEAAEILLRQLNMSILGVMRRYWTFSGLILGFVLPIAFYAPVNQPVPIQVALRIGQISSICVGSASILLMLVTFFFGVRFRVHAQAVIYGLSLYMLAKLVMHALIIIMGVGTWPTFETWLKPVYHLSLMLWIVCLWRDEPRRKLSLEMEKLLMFPVGRAS